MKTFSNLLSTNYAAAVTALGLTAPALTQIDWLTDKPSALGWPGSQSKNKSAIACYPGRAPKTRLLIPGAWRLDDEVIVDVYVKGDTLPNMLQQRANLRAVVNSILESNSNSITNFFIKPKSDVPNELASWVKQTITVTISIIQ